MRHVFLVLLFLLSGDFLTAQNTHTRKEFFFLSDVCSGPEHITTFDGGVLIAIPSSFNSNGYLNFTKTNAAGVTQWYYRIEVNASSFDEPVQLPDSGYFFCYVAADSNSHPHSYIAVRLDQYGNLVYSREISLPGSKTAVYPGRALPKNDGGVYMCATVLDTLTMEYSLHLLELDSAGNVLMSNCYCPSDHYNAVDIDSCSNGDLIILGSFLYANPSYNMPTLTRIAKNGNMIWSRTYRTPGRRVHAQALAHSKGDNFYVMSNSPAQFGRAEGELLKVDGAGNVLWTNMYFDNTLPFYSWDMQVMRNYDIVIGGFDCMGRLDSNGVVQCARWHFDMPTVSIDSLPGGDITYSGLNVNTLRPILQTSGPCGETCSDTTFVLSVYTVNIVDSVLTGVSVQPWSDSAIVLQESFTPMHEAVVCSTVGINEQAQEESMMYPNPVTDVLTIHSVLPVVAVEIIDVSGRTALAYPAQNETFTLDLSSLHSGCYFVHIHHKNNIESRRLIVE